MIKRLKCRLLLARISLKSDPDMSVPIVGRDVHLGDRRAADAGVGQLIADKFVELFTDAGGDALVPMRVHTLRIAPALGGNNAAPPGDWRYVPINRRFRAAWELQRGITSATWIFDSSK